MFYTPRKRENLNDRNSRKYEPQNAIRLKINGHEITASFAEEYDPRLASLVKETLLDSFLRQSGMTTERLFACSTQPTAAPSQTLQPLHTPLPGHFQPPPSPQVPPATLPF